MHNADIFPCRESLIWALTGIITSYIPPYGQMNLEAYKRTDTGFVRYVEYAERQLVVDEDFVIK